jgi:hypothetical protein
LAGSGGKEEEGRRPGVAGDRGDARTDGAEESKGEEGGRRGADRWGPYVSGRRNKRKEKRKTGRCGKEEVGCWATWAEREEGFLCFFFFFSNSNFSFQIQTKILQTFSQNFINFLNFTQATKNSAKPNNYAQTLVVSKLIKLN